LDLPFEAKDWWTFLIPGGFFALQLVLLYDILAQIGVTYKLPLEHFDLLQFVESLNSGQATLFVLGFLVLSLMVGFALELLTYKLLGPETENTLQAWITDIIKTQSMPATAVSKLVTLCNQLWGAPSTQTSNLSPAMVWMLLYNLWSKGRGRLVDDLDKTITSWIFCRSMSLSSAFGLILVVWAFVNGLPIAAIGSFLGAVLLVLFFRNQRKEIRKAYFRKVIMYSLTL